MSDLSRVTAVILAGGLGTRLRAVVSDRPKVMAEINGVPFLFYLFDKLNNCGIRQVVISTGYMASFIQSSIGFSYKNLQLDYSSEEIPLGTAGAVKLAGHSIHADQCLVMNGDSYTQFDPVSLFMSHKQKVANITILLKMVEDTARFGTIKMNERNEIEKFIEKGQNKDSNLINTGIYLMKTSIFQDIPDTIPCSLEYDFFPSKVGQNIYGFETKGEFIDIGTPKSYADAESALRHLL